MASVIALAIFRGIGDNSALYQVGVNVLNSYFKDPQQAAKGCVIWMHGLGADASDMAGLAEVPAIASLPLRHVFVDAPVRPVTLNAGMSMRAWYDIRGVQLTDREDKAGIEASQLQILQVIDAQIQAGFQPEQIFLAGFSQGGAMALYTALHSEKILAGVIALSSYLPMAMHCQSVLARDVPFFLGSGQFDPLVLPEWSKQSMQWLQSQGYNNLAWHQYPMEHSICLEEINDIANWLSTQLKGARDV